MEPRRLSAGSGHRDQLGSSIGGLVFRTATSARDSGASWIPPPGGVRGRTLPDRRLHRTPGPRSAGAANGNRR